MEQQYVSYRTFKKRSLHAYTPRRNNCILNALSRASMMGAPTWNHPALSIMTNLSGSVENRFADA
jgi:hypothetical protein